MFKALTGLLISFAVVSLAACDHASGPEPQTLRYSGELQEGEENLVILFKLMCLESCNYAEFPFQITMDSNDIYIVIGPPIEFKHRCQPDEYFQDPGVPLAIGHLDPGTYSIRIANALRLDDYSTVELLVTPEKYEVLHSEGSLTAFPNPVLHREPIPLQ